MKCVCLPSRVSDYISQLNAHTFRPLKKVHDPAQSVLIYLQLASHKSTEVPLSAGRPIYLPMGVLKTRRTLRQS